jgi:hypothetical protein
MGTFETQFTFPDLTVKREGLAISSVVLSNQREPLSAAVGSATNKKKLLDIHPLVMDGQKLVPSITRGVPKGPEYVRLLRGLRSVDSIRRRRPECGRHAGVLPR